MRISSKGKGFWALLLLLTLLLLLIHRNWLFSLAPLISGDWPYFSAQQLKEWFPFFHLWIPYDGLGRGISQGNFVFLFSLYGWLAQAGFTFEVISRLLFFIPVALLTPYSAFIAVKQITANNTAALLAAFVYSLNTYFLVIQGGHMHLSMVYALAPLAYYFAYKNAPRSYFWLFSILAIAALYDVRMTLVVGLFSALIALWRKVKTRKDFIIYAKKMTVGIATLVLIHSFWILPTLFFTSSGPFTNNIFSQAALNWVSQSDSLTLHHPFWSQYGVTDFVFAPVPFYMYFLPLIAFLPFTLPGLRFKKELLFFGTVGVVSIVFLMQENSLFSEAYRFIYYHVPLMSMFRESSKMFFVTAFCYSALVGLLIAVLLRRGRRGWAALSSSLVIFALIIPAAPYIVGRYVKTFKKEPQSADIQAINHIVRDGEGNRTLWVSRTPKFATASNQASNIDALEFGMRFWGQYADRFDSLSYLERPYTLALLNFAGIRHVVVPAEGINSAFTHYNNMPSEYYKDVVNSIGLVDRQHINTSTVWKNPNPKPHMYFATNTVGVSSVAAFSGIDDDKTAGYIFADQNKDNPAQALLSAVTNNTELNPFEPKYLHIGSEQITSSHTPPLNQSFDLYQTNPATQKRTFTIAKNYDSSKPITQPAPEIQNLYPDGSFENSASFRVSDCNNYDRTSLSHNGISGKLVNDRTDGRQALRITAGKHLGCFSEKVESFDSTASYLISLDYKYVSGPAPSVGLYPYTLDPVNRHVALSIDKPGAWSTYQTIITSNYFSDEMFFNVYVPTSPKRPSEVLFDNIRIYKLRTLPEAYLRTHNPGLEAIPFQKVEDTPTSHRLKVSGLRQPRLFVFSETFDPNWQLSIRKINAGETLGLGGFITGKHSGFTLSTDTHIVANGFANGWLIDPNSLSEALKNDAGEYELVLEYMPQRWFLIGSAVSGIILIACTIYLLYSIRHTKADTEGRWRWR